MYTFFIVIFVQIILESFPVSSSGHILLLEHFLQFFYSSTIIAASENKIVSYFLHGPTVAILTIFFWDRWTFLVKHIATVWKIIFKIIAFVFVADLASFFWYLLFKYKVNISDFPVGVGFLISFVCLYSLRFLKRETYETLTWQKALLIGLCQGIALLPGVSRFGLTFVVGCWLGLPAKKSFEFSFAIQWPLILAGFIKSIIKLSSVDAHMFFNICTLLITLISSIVAFYSLHLVYMLALTNRLWIFSIILLGSFGCWVILSFLG